MLTKPTSERRFAIVIPACDEEECIGRVLDELFAVIDPEKFVVAVGVFVASWKRDLSAALAGLPLMFGGAGVAFVGASRFAAPGGHRWRRCAPQACAPPS